MNNSNFVQFSNFESTAINKLWYSEKTKELIVEIKNGEQYRYGEVSPEEWRDLIQSQSKGKFITQNIKSKPYQKMVLHD